MNKKDALEFFSWHYEEPYTFYNAKAENFNRDLDEILNENNGIFYFSVFNENNELFGIFEYEFETDGEMKIGLGLAPEYTGQRLGYEFITRCLSFGRKLFNYHGSIILDVYEENERAIHVYEKMGFIRYDRVLRANGEDDNIKYPFICMRKSGENDS